MIARQLKQVADTPEEVEKMNFVDRIRDAFSESDLPFKVDLVDWARTQDNFRKIIAKLACSNHIKSNAPSMAFWNNLLTATHNINESTVEHATLAWLGEIGYACLHGPDIASDGSAPERCGYHHVVLEGHLQAALSRLNPAIPADARADALRKVIHPENASALHSNRAFHRLLVEGVPLEYPRDDGSIAGDSARLLDFDNPHANDWLAVNQFTVVEDKHRRPDVVVFVNGLPLAVIELKNPTDEQAAIRSAFNQLQTYQADIPSQPIRFYRRLAKCHH